MNAKASASEVVEVRCPVGPKRLLMKIRSGEETSSHVVDSNLLEVSCRFCTKNARAFDSSVSRVLHRFNLLGTLVESIAEHVGS